MATQPSCSIAVIGMHRSGTSAVARGLAALGVELGNNFLDAQPENPAGYWEDKGVVELDERVLKALRLKWDDAAPIDPRRFGGWRMWRLRREAIRYLRRHFTDRPRWGFKDPRTIRLLPFWLRVLRDCHVHDSYLLVIRNPSSVAASLFARQGMELETAQRLWLVYVVPFLRELSAKRFVVVDYDLLMSDPRTQLERMGHMLGILRPETMESAEVGAFAGDFLDAKLRHTVFSPDEIDATTDVGRLTRDAYALLYELAADLRRPDDRFWSAWEELESRFDMPSMTRGGRVEPGTRG
jgi:hypothetical protein